MSVKRVQLWNDNVHPYKGNLRGDPIHIPAKSFIEVDKEEADIIRGNYVPYFLDAGGQQDPRSYSMLVIRDVPKPEPTLEAEGDVARRGKPPKAAA